MGEKEEKEAEKDTNEKMAKFVQLARFYSAGFIDKKELLTMISGEEIDVIILGQSLDSKFGYVSESAAEILTTMTSIKKVKGINITSLLIATSLPKEGYQSEVQKRIAEMARQRSDYGAVKQQLLKGT